MVPPETKAGRKGDGKTKGASKRSGSRKQSEGKKGAAKGGNSLRNRLWPFLDDFVSQCSSGSLVQLMTALTMVHRFKNAGFLLCLARRSVLVSCL